MTTTSLASIFTFLRSRVEAITPAASPTDRPFRYNVAPSRPLRPWLPDAGGNSMFRRFELERAGQRLDIGINNLEEGSLCEVPFLVLLAYPARPHLYGLQQRYDLEALIEADARQIRDSIFLGGLESDAHHANLDPLIQDLDRSNEDVWFQEITFVAVFDAAQT